MQTVREVMTEDPVCLETKASVREAAQKMRDGNIGNVIITQGGKVHGILTDRDIVIRCVADRDDVAACTCGEICSTEIVTVRPDEPVARAVALLREHAIRRLIVISDDERPVGALSLGDLAVERDRDSALGEISAAPPQQ
jgi:CBS domain-containing protein